MKKFEREPKKSNYDVVIIGGAIMGSSAAWFLSQNPNFNGTILVVEKDQNYEFCSTAHTTSCMRQQFSTKLNVQISGLDACPSFKIISDDWLKYKTLISKKMLERSILAANTTYLSIYHNKKLIDKYIEELSKIFKLIFLCEKKSAKINDVFNTPVCHTGFKRLN